MASHACTGLCMGCHAAIVGLAAQGLWFEHQADARTAENFMAFEHVPRR